MRKFLKLFIIISLIFCILVCLTGCGDEKKDNNKSKSFSVKLDEINIAPGNKFDEGKIAEEANVSEIPSCAFDGIDKIYTYSNVEITVSDINGVPTVYSVYFKDDTIYTEEGLKISDNKDLMIEKYGKDYNNSLKNKYDYTKGDTTLSFVLENDIITGIEYTLITK